MVYLDSIKFPDSHREEAVLGELVHKMTCFDTVYPFNLFSSKDLKSIDFENVTILYGSNGSGKSTVLNIIADKIGSDRVANYNRSSFFDDYVALTKVKFQDNSFKENIILTSDGVFDKMIDIRSINEGIDEKREDLLDKWMKYKFIDVYPDKFSKKEKEEYAQMKREPLKYADFYHELNISKTSSKSSYIRKNVVDNIVEHSNGESAFTFFINRVNEDGIYLLDEPENSLSPMKQIELVDFLEKSARYFNCQLIIATHSPFILSMKGAKIYDLDETPVDLKKWTELKNVRTYYEFFKRHEQDFEC